MTNVTLTAEQAQQIEEALVKANHFHDYEDALATIRAARAHFQSETSIENNPADSFKANYPVAWKCLCGANLYIDSDGSPASKAEQAEQPVSQEYQDHLVNQSFDWAAMAAKHQFMEGYRIGLAEMREKCAKVCDDKHDYMCSRAAAAIRAIRFEGDTGFRPVSEMIAEHKQDPKKAAAIEKAKMRKAEQEPVAWHHPECEGECIACLIERAVKDAFGSQGLAFMLRHINTAPVRTKDLTDDEIREVDFDMHQSDADLVFARAVIAEFKEKNNANNNS